MRFGTMAGVTVLLVHALLVPGWRGGSLGADEAELPSDPPSRGGAR